MTSKLLEFYGLNRNPFLPPMDDAEIFVPARWEQTFDLLTHYSHSFNKILTLVSGKGVGKTTFIQQYIAQLNDTVQVCYLSNGKTLTRTKLLSNLEQHFLLPAPTGETFEEQLDSLLANIQHCKYECLLIIDNVQDLSPEILQTVLYLVQHQSEIQMRLHVILVGNNLNAKEDQKEFIKFIEFSPFDLAETQAYLSHRLYLAGLPAKLPFTPAALKKIQQKSRGLPPDINRFAPQVLATAMQIHPYQKKIDFIQHYRNQLLGGLIFLTVLVFGVTLFAKASHYQREAKLVLSAQPKTLVAKNSNSVSHDLIKNTSNAPIVSHVAENVGNSSASNKTNAVLNQDLPALPILTQPSILLTQSSPAVMPAKPVVNPVPKKVAKIISKPITKSHLAVKNNIPKINNSSAVGYTLQLIGLSNEKSMENFVALNKLDKSAAYYHTQLKGKDWYVILYGEFPTQEAAKAAVTKLPAQVQAQKPWVRTLASVQYPIKKLG